MMSIAVNQPSDRPGPGFDQDNTPTRCENARAFRQHFARLRQMMKRVDADDVGEIRALKRQCMGIRDHACCRSAGHIDRDDFRTVSREKPWPGPNFEGSSNRQPRVDARKNFALVIASQ